METREKILLYASIFIICILVCALLGVGGMVAYWTWPVSGYVIGAAFVLAIVTIWTLKLW